VNVVPTGVCAVNDEKYIAAITMVANALRRPIARLPMRMDAIGPYVNLVRSCDTLTR
jgi:hypothetical protein